MDWLAKAVSYVTSAENLPGMKRLYDVEREAMRSRRGMYPSGLSWSAGATDHAVSAFAPSSGSGGGGGGSSFASYISRMQGGWIGTGNDRQWRGIGWNAPGDRRGITGGGSLGYSRLLASTVSTQVDQPLNTHDAGTAQALQRNVQMVRSMASGVSAGFENMFNSIFMIQRRSKNIVVALFQDLFNGIVSGLTQRAGSAIGGWFLDLALSFIPGGGAVKGAAAAGGANTVINYTSLTAPNLVQSAISPSGELRQANTVLRQMAAVR